MDILSGIFAILCSVILPIAITVIFCVRKKEIWKPILFGALTFTFFQAFFRVPLILTVLPNQEWYIVMESTRPMLYALFLGGTSALFEEGGRFFVMSLFLKKQRNTVDGIAFGVGHGGIEAMFAASVSAISMALVSNYTSYAESMLVGGVERLLTIVIQIGLSVMVMKTVQEKNYFWLVLAFLTHTIVGFGVEMLKGNMNVWALEAVIFAAALLAAWFIYYEYKKSTFALSNNKGN